eukprot:42804-Eustigmatos_ZCMA.PRE.1
MYTWRRMDTQTYKTNDHAHGHGGAGLRHYVMTKHELLGPLLRTGRYDHGGVCVLTRGESGTGRQCV